MAPVPLSSFSIPALLQRLTDIYTNSAPYQRSASSSLLTSAPSSPPLLRRVIPVVSIPATYGGLDSGPKPGAVVGIILGTVGGVIIVLYAFYLWLGRRYVVDERSEISSEMAYYRRRRRPEVVERLRRPGPGSRPRNTVVVEESEVSRTEDDIVEVIEEHSTMSPSSPSSATPPPRRAGRGRRYSGSYRTVDPYEYGGGSGPARHVRR
ncbi:hypothetical protein VTN00DRAFT_9399 [Thermoascus crustaceus]|uniref:uncharacterized protein n=1 Tax=Thermoascus crustaceus TaxID=5088 RepID=UPI0037441B87